MSYYIYRAQLEFLDLNYFRRVLATCDKRDLFYFNFTGVDRCQLFRAFQELPFGNQVDTFGH